ncbi:MAG: glycosyl transferase, partial [Oscillospiraceae bacterium]|nr:glycosyl transferase [Oscillospiraceae bacterium]
MKYGYFDDALREYVITTPRTPLPWINYLGCEDFFTLVSNTAGGYCFYRDARLRRLTRYRYNNSPLDSEGFRVYLRDGNSVWNPGWQPVQAEPDSYCCRQGLGYTVIEAEKDSIAVRQEMLVPRGDNCLLIRLTLCNNSAEPRKLQVFPYLEFCLWDANDDGTNFQRNYSIGEVEIAPNAVYHKTEYRERRNHYAVFWSDRPADGFDTSREAFLGVYGSPAHPAAVFGEGCTGSVAHGWQPVAAQQFNLDLAPGESTSLLFGLGYLELPAAEKWASPGCINRTP